MRTTRNLLLAASILASAQPALAEEARHPNILVIVADDLGFSDIGAFGSEIETPNLDAIANRGIKLTGFHTAPTCSPTRSMLVTGIDNHQAGLGNMAEVIAPNQVGKPGHEGYLRPDTATIAELLGAGGYRTHYSGKWHLGIKPEQAPHSRGFQTSFALLQGGSNHFGQDDTPEGKTVDGKPSPYSATYLDDGKPVQKLPADFYSSDYFATKLIDQLKGGASGRDKDKPFFAYLSFTAPHWPLQAPKESIAKYKGRYDTGFEALRDERLKRQKALGILDPSIEAHAFDLAPFWNKLSPEEKALSSRRMEVLAAMVDRLDSNVGRVIQTLKETGELDNTIILFLSDNGAEGTILSNATKPESRNRAARSDNSIGNLGAGNSYDAIGPGWAEAATAPSWRVKAFETEGGTRVVSFLAGPGIKPGVGTAYANVMDVVPTLLDLAHVPQPGSSFQGRKIVPIRGRSWVPWLNGRMDRVYPADAAVGGELFGGKALRQGNWKLLDKGDGQWRLFNIAQDPGETKDLAASDPRRVAALTKAWDAYAKEVGVVLPSETQQIVTRKSER